MKVLILITSLGVMAQAAKDCREVTTEFNTCTQQAHTNYKAAMRSGPDGRKDFAARKACNYLEEGVETCGNKLIGECNSEQKVTEMKDNQIRSILEKLLSSVKAWDSNKCPSVKASIDRMKAAEEAAAEQQLKTSAQMGTAQDNGGVGLATSGLLLGIVLLLSFQL
jgi:hypothetical protein